MMERKYASGKHEHVAWIHSASEPDIEYQIVKMAGKGLKCACLGWAFKKGEKTCKHVQAYQDSTALGQELKKYSEYQAEGYPPLQKKIYKPLSPPKPKTLHDVIADAVYNYEHDDLRHLAPLVSEITKAVSAFIIEAEAETKPVIANTEPEAETKYGEFTIIRAMTLD
jgi:hypothetical protein